METNRRLRCWRVGLSLLVVIASFPVASYAAPRPTMKELLATQELVRPVAPFPLSVRIASVTITETAGKKGDLNNRWHTDDAFRGTYDQEFYDGLAYYLKGRGFKVSASKGGVVARIYIERFTGRKGSREYGGDMKGTLVLRSNGKELGRLPLSESLSYRDEKEERRAFAKEFSQDKVRFDTVLFYNLTVGFYDSIAQGILDETPDLRLGMAAPVERNAQAQHAIEDAPPTPAETAPPARVAAPMVREIPPPPTTAMHATAPQVQPQELPPPPPQVQPTPQPQASARPKPAKAGILTIESDPDDAEIYLGSKLLATTPVKRLRLAAGDHTITIRKTGYADWVREIKVLEDADVTLRATLESNQPKIQDQEEQKQEEPKEEPGIPKQEEPEEENLNE